jgi:hypothetical protein
MNIFPGHRLEEKLSVMDPVMLDNLKARAISLKAELESPTKETSFGSPQPKKSSLPTSNSSTTLQALLALSGDRSDTLIPNNPTGSKRLEELLLSAQRVLNVADDVPLLVQRLKTLEYVHLSAADAVQRLLAIESTADALQKDVETNQELLITLQKV